MYREDGYKEVPNLVLTLITSMNKENVFPITTVINYSEDFSNRNGAWVNFTTGLLSPALYDAIISGKYSRCLLRREMTWRSADDGTDYSHTCPTDLEFTSIELSHTVGCEGEPVQWEFSLRS